MSRRKVYTGRVHLGGGKYHWVGRFPTRKARDTAVARARVELGRACTPESITCGEWADRYLVRYERDRKASSADTVRSALLRFKADFSDRPLDSITRIEALDWAEWVPVGVASVAVTCMNAALDAELIERNPFRGLGRRGRGRADQAPPTEEQFERLLGGCSALGWYAPQMRSLIVFAAYSGMRPGELFALEWSDIDFTQMRIDVQRRVYKGVLDTPKSGKMRRIALTPPARDALLGLPTRAEGGLVFVTRTGKRLSQPVLTGYWAQVKARANIEKAFYLCTKHFAVHYMHAELGLAPRVIAEQMGWTLAGVLKLLAIYGHGDVGALEEIDRAFQAKVTPLRAVKSDAGKTQTGT
jgi:integrase